MDNKYSQKTLALMAGYQRDEETASVLYKKIAGREKDENNKNILLQIANDEKEHALVWKNYTGKEIAPNMLKVGFYGFLSLVLGYTFVIKLMENGEYTGVSDIKELTAEIPEVDGIIKQEKQHEQYLAGILDEERLKFTGAVVLGLNDALVELTGAIAGLTFALANTRLIALAGIVTGVAATLSMAVSNYLAQRADNNPKAFKASVYTGVAYLVTVVLLVLPYMLFPENMYGAALAAMLGITVLIIAAFNYYISVTKSQPFTRRFVEMLLLSLGVALIAFIIGLLAKKFLGIEM